MSNKRNRIAEKENKRDSFFVSTEPVKEDMIKENNELILVSEEEIEEPVKKSNRGRKPSVEELKKQTYYFTPEIIKALGLMGAFESKDKSRIIREALLNHIPKQYFDMIKED